MTVFDASALLAFLQDERGGESVRTALEQGGRVSAANWSETAQKVTAGGGDWQLVRTILLSYDLTIEAVTARDAESAAALWRQGEGLSLGDRLCLALGARTGEDIFTADGAWVGRPGVVLVR